LAPTLFHLVNHVYFSSVPMLFVLIQNSWLIVLIEIFAADVIETSQKAAPNTNTMATVVPEQADKIKQCE